MKKVIICLISLNIVASEENSMDNSLMNIYVAWTQNRDRTTDHSWRSSQRISVKANPVEDDATARIIQIEDVIKRTAQSIIDSFTE